MFNCNFTLGHDFFICWMTSHFQEFQSVGIRKKIKIKIELEPKIRKLM